MTDNAAALFRAARNGHADTIRRLVTTADVSIDSRDSEGRSALHNVPLGKGHRNFAKAIDTLIELGLSLECQNNNGRTALHIATINGNAAVCQLLTDRGANVNAQDSNAQTPLHLLARAPPSMNVGAWLEIVNILLASGADQRIRDSDSCTASDYVKASNDAFRLLRLHPETAECLELTYGGKKGHPPDILLGSFRALCRKLSSNTDVEQFSLMLEAEMPDAIADEEVKIVRYSALYQYWFRAHRMGVEELVVKVRLGTVDTMGEHKRKMGDWMRVLARGSRFGKGG